MVSILIQCKRKVRPKIFGINSVYPPDFWLPESKFYSGVGIVLNVRNSEVISMVSFPDFNHNLQNKAKNAIYIFHNATLMLNKRSIGEQIIARKTSREMRKLLRAAVTDGTGRRASIKAYSIGGKTGSAVNIAKMQT